MDARFEIETSLGPVWLHGRDTGRPILLVVFGAFERANMFWKMQDAFPDADVLRAHLPGNHCPPLAETSITAFTAAFDEALAQRWADRPLMALGVSVGGLVVLGLRSPMLRRVLAVEPPLITEGVWPLAFYSAQTPRGGEAFVWNVFGVAADRMEPRDHSGVLDGLTTPTLVLVGDDPLEPPRQFARLPTLVSVESLARLARHPWVTVETVTSAGHNIIKDAPAAMHDAVVRTWNATVATIS